MLFEEYFHVCPFILLLSNYSRNNEILLSTAAERCVSPQYSVVLGLCSFRLLQDWENWRKKKRTCSKVFSLYGLMEYLIRTINLPHAIRWSVTFIWFSALFLANSCLYFAGEQLWLDTNGNKKPRVMTIPSAFPLEMLIPCVYYCTSPSFTFHVISAFQIPHMFYVTHVM